MRNEPSPSNMIMVTSYCYTVRHSRAVVKYFFLSEGTMVGSKSSPSTPIDIEIQKTLFLKLEYCPCTEQTNQNLYVTEIAFSIFRLYSNRPENIEANI